MATDKAIEILVKYVKRSSTKTFTETIWGLVTRDLH